MKILLIIFLLPSVAVSFAQKKKDNVIIITGFIHAAKIKDVLFRNGYAINNSDTSYFTTEAKAHPTAGTTIKLIILKTDTITYVKGLNRLTGRYFANDDFEQLYLGGMKGSFQRVAWDEMDKIAKQMSPNITYAKQ